jgi:hypothetical protein
MAVNLSPIGGAGAQFFDNNGNPLSGGKLYTYAAGTSTPAVTYTSSSGATQQPNPIILDAAGRVPGSSEIWLTSGSMYKFLLKTSADVLLGTWDNVPGINDLAFAPYTPDATSLLAPGPLLVKTALDQITNRDTGSSVVGYLPPFPNTSRTTVRSKLAQTVNVADFGAVGNGTTDDTAAIQAAINYVQAQTTNQIQLQFEAKRYRIAGTLNITGTVRLVGQGFYDFDNARPRTLPGKGTWLIHANAVGPMISVTGNLGKGAGLFDIAIFQEGHPTPTAGWTPAVRDWVIRNENTQGTMYLNRVHFHNVYKGVFTDFAVRPQYENITGQFFYRGFSFDRIYDIGKFDGLHAWTYWSENDYVLQYQQANCVEITLYRVDGLWMDRIFSFAVAVSLFVTVSPYGGSAKVIMIDSFYSDFCGRAIVVDSSSNVHLQVSNIFHLGQAWPGTTPPTALPGSALIDVASGSNHLIQIGNAYDVLAETHAIRIDGTYNTVWVGSGIFEQYSRGSAGNGAAYATATNILRLGAEPLLNPYAGGVAKIFDGTPGGTAFEQTRQVVTQGVVNYPVTAGNTAGQLVAYTAEGEATAGVAVVAKSTGTVNIGTGTNLLGFYNAAATARQTGVPVTAAGIHAALVNLGLIAP